ncbi:MAG: DNA-processing protein DprA [Pseudomonadota bacterium]
MTLSTATQATLLLASYFSKPAKGAAKPLTPTEWGAFAQWLHEQGHTPADLLGRDVNEILQGWRHPKVTIERLEALLQRGSSMALALEKWQRSGLWVITRSDPAYPKRLKKRLKHAAPPVLYGCGSAELLNVGGLAVVGSRKAGDEDLTYACRLGAKATQVAIGIVSGGAKGIDEAAMQGAIQEGGPVIGILSEGLLKAATSSQWRQGLMSGGLVLVSPYYPEASFNTGNAMGRNKYIYCLADAALVVHSGTSGGTKAGAEENLKKGWLPLWVKPTQDTEAGNQALVDAGGTWCEENIEQLDIGSLLALPETPSSLQGPDKSESVSSHEPGTDDAIESSGSEPDKAGEIDGQPDVAEAMAHETQQEPEAEEPEVAPSSGESDAGCREESTVEPAKAPQPDLFGSDTASDQGAEEAVQSAAPEQVITETTNSKEPEQPLDDPAVESREAISQPEQIDFYQLFLSELQRLARNPKTVDEITSETSLHKTQVNAWLKQALEEGRVKKLNRPVRYQAIPEEVGSVDDEVERLVRRLRAPRSFETSS